MMQVVWLQVVSGDWSNYYGAKGDGPFGRGIAETSKIARSTSGIEDKAVATKAQTWKVRQWLTRSWVCAEKKDLKRSRDWRVTRLGAAQTIGCCILNTWKLELRRHFFPGRTCKPFACKRNYFVLQSETATFPGGEREMWNVSMWLNEQCWRGTISFSAVFH